jgi:hypothetical protein
MRTRTLVASSLLLSAGLCMPACANGGEQSGGDTTSAVAPSGVMESIAAIKAKYGAGPVRVILTVRSGESGFAEYQSELVRRLKVAGALSVEPIQGQPLVVVECPVDTLEELARSGLVTAIMLDALDAPN